MSKFFLLADDDPDDVAMFREALSIIDPTIIFHHSPDGRDVLSALDEMEAKKPDIIFLDINMPVMNGWECLVKIKQNELFRHIPVVIYSTAFHHREIDKAFDMGALCFFTKPTDFKELINNLNAFANSLSNNNPALISHLNGVRCKVS